jgi:hypothetical protein
MATTGMSVLFLGVWPKDTIAWLCVLAVGPIAFFLLSALGELAGEVIGRTPGIRGADRAIERRTAPESISGTRIAYYLVRSLLILVPLLFLSWWLQDKVTSVVPGALRDWWIQHFK